MKVFKVLQLKVGHDRSTRYDIGQYEICSRNRTGESGTKEVILYLSRMNSMSKPHSNLEGLPGNLAAFIDHTLLHPTALEDDFQTLCEEAVFHAFKAVCVPGAFVGMAATALQGSGVDVATVIGFPLGTTSTRAKCNEAGEAFREGAKELDVVMNPTWMRSGNLRAVASELSELRETVPDACLKLILETCYLTDPQKQLACQMAVEAGWDFVKTSTGFGSGGATLEDVRLMKKVVGDQLGVKASGGIRDLETALSFLRAGATRLGTSSGVALIKAARH